MKNQLIFPPHFSRRLPSLLRHQQEQAMSTSPRPRYTRSQRFLRTFISHLATPDAKLVDASKFAVWRRPDGTWGNVTLWSGYRTKKLMVNQVDITCGRQSYGRSMPQLKVVVLLEELDAAAKWLADLVNSGEFACGYRCTDGAASHAPHGCQRITLPPVVPVPG